MYNYLTGLFGGNSENGGGMLGTVLMLVVMVGVFYFLLIRPENKRKKEAEQMRSNVHTGDKVTTIGGIVGTVVSVKDDKFVLETGADQVRVEFAKWAISTNETAAENVPFIFALIIVRIGSIIILLSGIFTESIIVYADVPIIFRTGFTGGGHGNQHQHSKDQRE